MITIDRLTLSYGSQQVLKDCSLQVEPGSRVALMGPSGCGKTSLINVIAGLLTPDSGKVSVNGKVSYVFQEPALFPWLTAVDNINVVLSDGPETLPRAEQLLEAVGLSDCRDKYPHQLSGGQKQRIAICRALAYGGDILLLDEPLKGLDADTRDQVSALLRQEWAGKTLLLVTHDPSEAESLCDRVYRWQEGTFR
jgi:NitT/TauT family transport system ATP-binding protein